MELIDSVVITEINLHAVTVMTAWVPVTHPEYLIWIALFIIMTTRFLIGKHTGIKETLPLSQVINYSTWMTIERFDAINKMHIFVVPGGTAHGYDKLYQLRAFIDAYNEKLKEVVIPGKYLCVDESMNQWLGHGMPNLKKIPRKPHSIGQEWKTVADVNTCCIIRLDVTGDTLSKKFDDVHPKTIVTVFRLVEPWFFSGRTVIADSWFSSPAMVCALKDVGLFSIMQVKKKRYWPRGMPMEDMVGSLGEEVGDVKVVKSRIDSVFIASLRDKKLKSVIANAGSTLLQVILLVDGLMAKCTLSLVHWYLKNTR
ncbi:hypothetical protein [Parasitella parasitica]|uniref:PiggyBac transposable element-derived protein domain-containing protein n=1 Tax=Parasitella parasitica TaxID=35722 RepID=A0A0B7N5I4_9FUNG|nr:hypothetical protein [Parasitella parasitica]